MAKRNRYLSGFIAFTSITLSFIAVANSEMSDAAIAERIAPIGKVYLAGETPIETIAAASGPRTGQTIYDQFCMACHTTGAAGAPKIGDDNAWPQRLAKGRTVLNDHAINGFNGMPARGTCMDCSDDEIIAAIDYLLAP